MEINFFTEQAIANIIRKMGTASNNMVIKHYNTFELDYGSVVFMLKEIDDMELIYTCFSGDDLQGAYTPFLPTIKVFYDKYFAEDEGVEEFVNNCKIYPLHVDVICNYLSKGVCFRDEDVLLPEVYYESVKFEITILKILSYISKKIKLFFVLNDINDANESTLRLVCRMIECQDNNNIGMLISYNEAVDVEDYLSDKLNALVNAATSNDSIYDYSVDAGSIDKKIKKIFYPKYTDVDIYMLELKNMFFTACFEQAVHYLDIICNSIDNDKMEVTSEQNVFLNAMYAMCLMYTEDYSTALIRCEKFLDYCKDAGAAVLVQFKYIQTWVYMGMLQSKKAEECAEECMELARMSGNKYYKKKSEIIYHMSKFCGWKNVQACFDYVVVDLDFTEKLKEMKFLNTLCYFYIYVEDAYDDLIISNARSKMLTGYAKTAFEISKSLDNRFFLSAAYMKIILLYANKGCYDYVTDLYVERKKLIDNFDYELEDDMTYDGLGYNCVVGEEYSRAAEYFNQSIEMLYKKNAPLSIAETLYNMSFNSMAAGYWKIASEYLECVVSIIDTYYVESIPLCNISKIYGFLAICYYYVGNDEKNYFYGEKIRRELGDFFKSDVTELDYAYWDDDLFLCNLINALTAKKDKCYEEAEEFFENTKYHMNRSPAFMFFSYPLYSREIYDLYIKMGEVDKAKKVLNDIIQYCKENGFEKNAVIFKSMIEDSIKRNIKYDVELSGYSLKDIQEIVKKQGKIIKYEKTREYISFLSNWRKLLEDENYSVERMINKAVMALKDAFYIDEMIYLKCSEDDEYHVEFSSIADTGIKNDKIVSVLRTFVKDIKIVYSVNRYNGDFAKIERIFAKIGIKKISLFIGIPIVYNNKVRAFLVCCLCNNSSFKGRRSLFKEHTLLTLKAAFGQLDKRVDYFIRRKKIQDMNVMLENMAERDALTGLYNRLGFSKVIQNISQNDVSKINTVLYVDIDNFKHYNDTYGHDMGDLLLVSFANIISNLINNRGFAVRYGGDEFIILLHTNRKQQQEEFVNQIYLSIKNKLPMAITSKRKDIAVDDLNIGCSIGVAYDENLCEENIEKILAKADMAMYKVKKTTKGSYLMED